MLSTIEINNLFDSYPELFKWFNVSCSFDIGKGWFSIVEDLCCVIDYQLKQDKMIKNFSFLKITNKFGTLYTNYEGGNDFILKVINIAEAMSFKTCEECGKKGKLYTSNGTSYGIMKTLCQEHSKDKYIQYEYMDDRNLFLSSLL